MKKIILSIFCIAASIATYSQSPQSFQYQAVVRDASGNVLLSQAVGFKLSIISGSVSGTVVYTEIHNVTTNTFGIVTLNVGSGTATYGTFSSINWNTASHFIKVEADPTGGTSYLNMGTTQLLSVPYALNAAKSDYSSVAGTANYVAGTGINVTGSTITNTAPNQIVTMTNGTGISITGSYPTFTVNNSSPNTTHTGDVTGSGALTIANNAVTTLKIADGNITAVKLNSMAATNGQTLKFNGTNWAPSADLNSGTPAGLNKTIQFNNAGVFGGNSKLIWDNSNERFGVGTASPLGRMVVQGSATALATEPLFEVKNKLGQTVFVVYQDSVNVFVNDDAIQSNRGGFAVSGRNNAKGFTHNYLKVTPDSTRIFTGDTLAGFGVGNIGASSSTSYMRLTPSNYFIGHESGQNIDVAGGGLYNNFMGYQAGLMNTSGMSNVLVGYQTGFNNMTGNGNTAVGTQSLLFNNFGNYNTAIGFNALTYNQTGEGNVATGVLSLTQNTTGSYNSAFGSEALMSNIGASNNSAFGYFALGYNTSGSENTAVGTWSLYSNTIGTYNTALGAMSLYKNTTGDYNTSIGASSLDSNTTGAYNTALGTVSLLNNTIGTENTASGYASLLNVTTGSYNSSYGFNALSNNITGNSNSSFGNGAYFMSSNLNNTTCIGYWSGGMVEASNRMEIGNSSVNWIGGQVAWSTYSDKRIKDNVKEDVPGLDFITRLRPVTYNLNIHRQNEMIKKSGKKDLDWDGKYDIEKIRMTGFLAQEVSEAAKEIGYDFSGIEKPKDENELYSLRYSEFTVPLVKAVQEQQIMINDLKNQNIDLQKQINELKTLIQNK